MSNLISGSKKNEVTGQLSNDFSLGKSVSTLDDTCPEQLEDLSAFCAPRVVLERSKLDERVSPFSITFPHQGGLLLALLPPMKNASPSAFPAVEADYGMRIATRTENRAALEHLANLSDQSQLDSIGERILKCYRSTFVGHSGGYLRLVNRRIQPRSNEGNIRAIPLLVCWLDAPKSSVPDGCTEEPANLKASIND